MESEELYQKLKEYKETTKRPIWDYMAHYAASGGYMVSMASDKYMQIRIQRPVPSV